MRRELAEPGRARSFRYQVLARTLAVLALVFFCWPFVHAPALSLWSAYLHLFGCWAIVIVVLGWMSRHLASGRDDRGAGDD